MLKEFAQYLAKQNEPKTVDVDGKTYIVCPNGVLEGVETHEIKENAYLKRELDRIATEELPEPMNVTTLTGVADYIKKNPDNYINSRRKAIIHIAGEDRVELCCQLDALNGRPKLLIANAITPKLAFGRRMSQEEFIIMMQSQFAQTEDRDKLLRIISHLKEDAGKETYDNGLAQTVIVKSGVATLSNEEIPNPAMLAPFRTFIEIEQPRSYYVCRLHDGGDVSLNDASGGEWRIQAIESIKRWFENNLTEEQLENTYIIA